MENLIYQNGIAIGMDCGDYISWFSSAPREAIEAMSKPTNLRPLPCQN